MARVEALLQLIDDRAVGRVEFDLLQMQASLPPDDLHRCFQTLPQHCGTQDVVTVDHTLQGVDKGVQTLTISDLEERLQNVRVALFGSQMVVENSLLQRCQRVDVFHITDATRHAGDNTVDSDLIEIGQWQHLRSDARAIVRDGIFRDCYFTSATHRCSQRCQGWLAEQHANVSAQAGLAHAFDEADGQQRVPAQFKEMVMSTDLPDLEHLGPDGRQQVFHFALRRFVATADQCLCIGYRQHFAVQLAVGCQWQRIEAHISCGHHVVRQAGLKMTAQGFDFQRLLWLTQGEIGDQALFSCVLPRQQHGFVYRRVRGQNGLDFTQFNTETANFHLIVVTAQVFQIAVGPPATQVAGAVHQRTVMPAEWIGDELCGAQFITVQIALGHALPAYVQLAGHAHRHRLTQGIEYINLAVGNRPADRNATVVCRSDLVGRGKGRGFGRAVAVEQMLRRALCQDSGDDRRVQHIAAHNQVAQARKDLHQAVGILMKQAGGEPQHADRLRQQQRPECLLRE